MVVTKVETNSAVQGGKTKQGNTRKGITRDDKTIYASLEEANANRPQGKELWRLFSVTGAAGRTRWTWAPHAGAALKRCTLADGYTVVDLHARRNVPALRKRARDYFWATGLGDGIRSGCGGRAGWGAGWV
jgi:hypothetical protein